MRLQLLFAALLGSLVSSCFSPGDGKVPPLERLYFPTGLVLDKQSADDSSPSRYLYVASSDFDLQYRSAALASYDLDLLQTVVPRSCSSDADCPGQQCDTEPNPANGQAPSYFCVAARGDDPCGDLHARSAAERLVYPGRCNSIPSATLLRDTVGIGAFASDIILRNSTAGGSPRLFLPVRGDATLHWIDVVDGRFQCGQENTSDQSCDGLHRAGDSTAENNDELRQPSEPFAIDATPDGRYLAITNQTSGSVSLFVNDWSSSSGPTLESVLTGLPQAPVAIAALGPAHTAAAESQPPEVTEGFLVGYRDAAQIDLLRVRSDEPVQRPASSASYTRFALTRAGSTPITANSLGYDSRGIAVDGDRVYVSNRAPSTLLVGGMTPDPAYPAGTSQLPSFIDAIALTAGPARVVLGNVKVPGTAQSTLHDQAGPFELERRVFVVCFDSRSIFIYDPKRHLVDSIVSTGRGPYALAVDDARGLAFVAHFTDSYLSVVSLDQRFPQNYATIVASIGSPTPPRTSK